MAEQETESSDDDENRPTADDHLAGVDDGCGCTEVWEHLSERREEE